MNKTSLMQLVLGACVMAGGCNNPEEEGSATDSETTGETSTTTDTTTTTDGPTTTASETDPTGGSETEGETSETSETLETESDSETSDSETSDSETSDSDTETTEGPGFCGDGALDPGEECDDGNDDNSDNCVEGCVAASCGDGFVGPGEACDDGNTDDGDECTSQCALASCGDGNVQMGEACDDANDDETDACLSTCVEASCGDGFVYTDVETCDDGNADETDACTSLCAAPACDDTIQSGLETDVDCGGPMCTGCEIDQVCSEGVDCLSGSCDMGLCVLAPNCAAILEADPEATDGVHSIDPDGQGPIEPFDAYCDMTTDGGGWTLVLRAAPTDGIFDFWSEHWETESVVNETVTDPTDPSDGKFPAYNHVEANEIRGCLQDPNTTDYGCKIYPLPQPTTTLDLFANTEIGSDVSMKGLYFTEENNAKLEWLTIQGRSVNEASINPNYIEVGINIDDDQSCYDARVRFGLVLNNENHVGTLNDAAGFGTSSYYTSSCDIPDGQDAPWRTACGFSAGPNIYHTAGQIWVR